MAVVLETVLGVPGISKRIGGVVEWIPLQLRVLLRVGVLGGEEVFKGGVVQGQSYIDISNIRIINMRILYLLNRHSSQVSSRS